MNQTSALPQLTTKAIALGVLLSMILAGANAYLGLFAGMTVSASIPAAVISMGILRMFRESNILVNNIVQTAASAGESLAAGVIFTIPALVILDDALVYADQERFDRMQLALLKAAESVQVIILTCRPRDWRALKTPRYLAEARLPG